MRIYTDWIEEAERLYKNGLHYNEIAQIVHADRKIVSFRLRELGYESDQRYVRKVPVEKLQKFDYSYAETLFNKIDTEVKAYWLGFLYADGDVSTRTNTVALAQYKDEIGTVIKFRDFFKLPDKKITKKFRNLNGKRFLSYEFAVTNEIIKNQLIALNCFPKKTFKTTFPNDDIVPANLKNHFVRGYFDGDGHIGKATTSVLSLEMAGTEAFLTGYQNWTGLRFNKLHDFTTTKIKHSMYSGFAAIAIMDMLYENATIYMESKHNAYLELRHMRMKSVKRPNSIIAEYHGKGKRQASPRLKALLDEAAHLTKSDN